MDPRPDWLPHVHMEVVVPLVWRGDGPTMVNTALIRFRRGTTRIHVQRRPELDADHPGRQHWTITCP